MTEHNTKGRKANAAQELGSRDGVVSDRETDKSGRRSTRRAGPDGPDAAEVGDTFKRPG